MVLTRELLVFLLAFAVVAVHCKPKDEHGRPMPHSDDLTDEEHEKDGEHNAEYDHEAFLGDMKDEFDHLSPDEAQRRLKILAAKLDTDGDQLITEDELKKWVKTIYEKKMVANVDSDLKEKDLDKDGFINWDEFMKDSYGDEPPSEEDEEMKKMIARDRKHFDIVDVNKDGKLTGEEFSSFMHPEYNPELQALNSQETLEDMDKDKDGQLSLEEFLGDYKDPENPDEAEPDWVKEETERFKNELDKDNDGHLNAEELNAWVSPDSDTTIIDEEVKHLISESDTDHDGKLSLDEIVEHHDVFTGSEATDYGQALPHSEL